VGGRDYQQYPSTAAQYFYDRQRTASASGASPGVAVDDEEALFLRETHLGRVESSPYKAKRHGAGKNNVSPVDVNKARSMVNLGVDDVTGDGVGDECEVIDRALLDGVDGDYGRAGRRRNRASPTKGASAVGDDPYSRAKSMEFLLDDDNKERAKVSFSFFVHHRLAKAEAEFVPCNL
jgi:hypothetical protein